MVWILTKTMNKLELEVVAAIEKTYPPLKLPVRVIVVSELEESLNIFQHIKKGPYSGICLISYC